MSIPIPRDEAAGGETDRRAADIEVEVTIGPMGSLLGRDPKGGMPATAVVGGVVMPTGPATEEEARITAAAALGADKLLSGTKGVWNIPENKNEN